MTTDHEVTTNHNQTHAKDTRGPGLIILAVLGPVLVLTSELITPPQSGDGSPAQHAQAFLDDPGRFLYGPVVGLAAAAVLAAAITLLTANIRQRGRVLARIAAVLGVAGATGLASHHAITLLIRDLYLIDPGSAGTIAAAEYGSASVITLLPVLIGLNLAVILLAIASTRARLSRAWVIVIAVVAFAANFFLPAGGTELFAILVATEFAMIAHGQGRTAVNPA